MSPATEIVKMVKVGAMALKAIVPGVLGNVDERELLKEDLYRIGCHRILEKPWNLRVKEMVAELMGEKDNRKHGTVRQAPKKWMLVEWWKVYGFPRQDKVRHGIANRLIHRW